MKYITLKYKDDNIVVLTVIATLRSGDIEEFLSICAEHSEKHIILDMDGKSIIDVEMVMAVCKIALSFEREKKKLRFEMCNTPSGFLIDQVASFANNVDKLSRRVSNNQPLEVVKKIEKL